ncbi:MAG: hypothetical protein KBC64_04245 [Simkaniaceae bacterium]|nr:hypothetical protein [Simkaniaceae bacterium]
MNFTREPILETIITPKEGYKIILRNSKLPAEEEYSVDALEVVSFGSAIFYRSLERPKPFLLPTTDYEVYESKDVRMVLKTAPVEKNIKIGGGKKAAPIAPPPLPPQEEVQSKKRRTRRRRMADEVEGEVKAPLPKEENPVAPPPMRALLPPPSSLISDHLSRYKNYQIAERATVVTEEKAPSEIIEETHCDECDDAETPSDISFLIDDELLKRD